MNNGGGVVEINLKKYSGIEAIAKEFFQASFKSHRKRRAEEIVVTLIRNSYIYKSKKTIINSIDRILVKNKDDIIFSEVLQNFRNFIVEKHHIIIESRSVFKKNNHKIFSDLLEKLNLFLFYSLNHEKLKILHGNNHDFIKSYIQLLGQFSVKLLGIYTKHFQVRAYNGGESEKKINRIIEKELHDRSEILSCLPKSEYITLQVLCYCVELRNNSRPGTSLFKTATAYYNAVKDRFGVDAGNFKNWLSRNRKYFPRETTNNKDALLTMTIDEVKVWYENYENSIIVQREQGKIISELIK